MLSFREGLVAQDGCVEEVRMFLFRNGFLIYWEAISGPVCTRARFGEVGYAETDGAERE